MNNLRKIRIEKGMSISELADLCNVTESYITKIERGNYKITKNMLTKLTKVLRVSVDDILDFYEDIIIEAEDVTFANNKRESIHRWYPYIEGFSQGFVEGILNKYPKDIVVYDPFNGSGTTTLTCAFNNILSLYSEINPFMRFVANTKVNTVKSVLENNKLHEFERGIESFKDYYISYDPSYIKISDFINNCYKDYEFFDNENLKQIAFIKRYYLNIKDKNIQDLFKLALGSILVECSNMIRSVDLRRRKGKELHRVPKDVFKRYLQQLEKMLDDIKSVMGERISETMLVTNNAKECNDKYKNKVDIIITSPPYVNGTNYFRNTKLELWILDFIDSENDLKSLRANAITAGINNVSREIDTVETMEFVEIYAKKLDSVAVDKRIPKLVRAYFSDMNRVFRRFNYLLKTNGEIYFDIGDSQYYGVHIPVDRLITMVASQNGFDEISNRTIRNRRSKNGMLLSQKIIVYKKKREMI